MVIMAGDEAQWGHEPLVGEHGNRGLLGGVEFDTNGRNAQQHRHDTVAASEPANRAAVAVDEHEALLHFR